MKKNDIQSLPQLAQDFLYHMDDSKSQLTVVEYASDLRTFFRWIAFAFELVPSDTPVDEVDLRACVDKDIIARINCKTAERFIFDCKENGNNPRTCARKKTVLRQFFRYLAAQESMFDGRNPMSELKTPGTGKSLPKYLTLEECRTLLAEVTGRFAERDYCMLIFFLNCGMRLSELVNLNLRDVRIDGTCRIKGKGNKERTIYLNDACLAALERYLKVRPQEGLRVDDRDALFISRNKRRINARSVELVLEKYLKASDLDGMGYSVHKLRHTAATLMYQHDVDILQLKDILGHENLATTEIYTHVVSEQLRAAVDANPLNQEGVTQKKPDHANENNPANIK
ncbi:MAG: tyrosine-type recombinase/integrase [Oscillospiraceae bacterium]|jgi:site-specific recombinase XerD|nr:tyrosine-type recombinase/integrase [Oscillospiraceae bacterium]